MGVRGYTKNYKLIKPEYNTDTWHDYEYDNLDTIDAVMSAIYASGNWKGFWATNTVYTVGDVIIDQATDTMYKVMVDHTTSEADFATEHANNPTYYELWSPNNLAESWATDTTGLVSNTDYSSKAYAVSSGLIDDGSSKEWAVGTGTIGNTNLYSAKKYATDAHNDYISMTTDANVAAVGSNIASVNTVAGISSAVSTVANKATEVDTVAWISNDVTTVAGVATAVSNVSNIQAAVLNVSDDRANVNLVAQNINNVNNVGNDITNVNKVGNDITNVDTVANNISNVNTAAANMTAIQNATTAASNAANSATASANSATASANSAEWSRQYANDKINQTHITNCITEIPQDIKLEMNNGTLTLKAGSKIYVPNGFEEDGTTPKFDMIVVESDKTMAMASFSGFVFYRNNNSFLFEVLQPTSGTVPPSIEGTWYDTSTNKIKRYANSSFVYDGISFPLCKFSSGSIDQVYNGFGYIGSTVFALPGVKGLIPNGRNADGTLKNEEFVTSKVLSFTQTNTGTIPFVIRADGVFSAHSNVYDEVTNKNSLGLNCVAGTYTASSGVITLFAPKLPFQAVDYNDSSWFRARFDENLKAGMLSPFAGSTAPDGWLICDGSAISRTTYADLFAVIGTTYGGGDGLTTFNIPNYTGARLLKGTTVPVKGNGKTLGLWNGTNAMGLVGSDTYRGSIRSTELNPYSPAYNQAVNNTGQKPDNTYTNKGYYGITTDAAKSGVVVDLSTSASVYYIIKY